MAAPADGSGYRAETATWTPADSAATVAWFVLALAARAPFVARIEGALDHDQSVVGLMALDISEGRRLPIFFDGQRYMGAVEAYVAAGFVRMFGHSPGTVALAPLLFFGLFAAGQFAVWRCWNGRVTGHLAALFTVFGSPFVTVWGLIPRGGYVEVLAWSLPTLAVYRRVVRRGRAPLAPAAQVGWGFLLAAGYFLNPLSMTVYATLALDWTFGRHGLDLRRRRAAGWRWLDSRGSAFAWLAVIAAWTTGLAFCCHVDARNLSAGSPYVEFGGYFPRAIGLALAVPVAVGLLGLAGWWTMLPVRLFDALRGHPWSLVGILAAFWPFVAFGALVRAGVAAPVPSLPAWIGAPWNAGANARHGIEALGTLVGCDPMALAYVFTGQGVEPPAARRPALASALVGLAPGVVVLAALVVAKVAAGTRPEVAERAALKGRDAGSGPLLALEMLATTVALYLLQGTSPNASSVRYLVLVWVALPGLLAAGLGAMRPLAAVLAGFCLLAPWVAAQWELWSELDRPSPARGITAALERRGVRVIVAPTPVALTVANLSHGRVGAVEYQPIWPRLGTRYADRIETADGLTCVVDTRFPWAIRGEGAWAPEQDLGAHLRALAVRHPGLVKLVSELDGYEIWTARVPLDEALAAEPSKGEALP